MEVMYQSSNYNQQLDSSLLLGKSIVSISTSMEDMEEFSGDYGWREGVVISLDDGTKLVCSYGDYEGGEFHILK